MPVVNDGHAEKAGNPQCSYFGVNLLQLSTDYLRSDVDTESSLNFRHGIRFRRRVPFTGADVVEEPGLPGQLIGPVPDPECLFITGGRRQLERVHIAILPAITLPLSHAGQRIGLMNEPDGRQLSAKLLVTAFVRVTQCCTPVHTPAP